MQEIRPFFVRIDPRTGKMKVEYYGVACSICGRKAEMTTRKEPGKPFICSECTARIFGVERMEPIAHGAILTENTENQ